MRYTEIFNGGYSKSYISIKDNYGPKFNVEKKESVGHVQKTVGCRLRNVKKKEKGIGRKRKLSNIIIDKLQNYYGIAIRQNKDNVTGIQAAVKATHFYVALSKDNNHHFPPGKDSWCA